MARKVPLKAKQHNSFSMKFEFPKPTVRLLEEFFETSFSSDIDEMKKGTKHPAHPINDRIRQLISGSKEDKPAGIDIPILVNTSIAHPKSTIVLLGQDPLRNDKDIDCEKKSDNVFIGTPYRFHHPDGLYKPSLIYHQLVEELTTKGHSVYLTDVSKYYPSKSKNPKDCVMSNAEMLIRELECLEGNLTLILSGKRAELIYCNDKNGLKAVVDSRHIVCVPHLSGFWALKKWRTIIPEVTPEAKIKHILEQIKKH